MYFCNKVLPSINPKIMTRILLIFFLILTSFSFAQTINVKAMTLSTPNGEMCPGINQTISVKIRNDGSSDINFSPLNPITLSVTIVGANPQTYSLSITSGPRLVPGGSRFYTLTTAADFSVIGEYSIAMSATCVGDVSPGIDATEIINVIPPPDAGVLTGNYAVCNGSVSTFISTIAGGSWSSSSPAIANVDASGNVTGVSEGTSIITYTVSGSAGCPDAIATRSLTVRPSPIVTDISGADSICSNTTTTLTNTTPGGVWTSNSPSIASVDAAGNILGRSAGNAKITYLITQLGCTSSTMKSIIVLASPNVASIYGSTTGCVGTTIQLSNVVVGGEWSSSSPEVATINTSGLVIGVSEGTSIISYTDTKGGCTTTETLNVTINPRPIPGLILGVQSICLGETSIYTSDVKGGDWYSTNPNVSEINRITGEIKANQDGLTIITYTIKGKGCKDTTTTKNLIVNSPPKSLTIPYKYNIKCSNSNVVFYNPYSNKNKIEWLDSIQNIISSNQDSLSVSKSSLYYIKVYDSICKYVYSIFPIPLKISDSIIKINELQTIIKYNRKCSNSNAVLFNPYSKKNKIEWYDSKQNLFSVNQDTLIISNSNTYFIRVYDSICKSIYSIFSVSPKISDTIIQINELQPLVKFNRKCSNSYAVVYNPYSKQNKIEWLDNIQNLISANQDSLLVSNSNTYFIRVYDNLCKNLYKIFSNNLIIRDTLLNKLSAHICMITNLNGYNLVVWNNLNNDYLAQYKIYKQSQMTSNYELIHKQSKHESSQWIDSLDNVSMNINRYKISFVDYCDNESQLSSNHTTILLTSNVGLNGTVNLLWNPYEGFDYQNFEIWRSTDGTNFMKFGSVANNSYAYIDNNPPATAWYQIRISKQDACNPTTRGITSVNSNIISKDGKSLGLKNMVNNSISIYPNPSNGSFTLNSSSTMIGKSVNIMDITGRCVYAGIVNTTSQNVSMENIENGTYFLSVDCKEAIKLIKE